MQLHFRISRLRFYIKVIGSRTGQCYCYRSKSVPVKLHPVRGMRAGVVDLRDTSAFDWTATRQDKNFKIRIYIGIVTTVELTRCIRTVYEGGNSDALQVEAAGRHTFTRIPHTETFAPLITCIIDDTDGEKCRLQQQECRTTKFITSMNRSIWLMSGMVLSKLSSMHERMKFGAFNLTPYNAYLIMHIIFVNFVNIRPK